MNRVTDTSQFLDCPDGSIAITPQMLVEGAMRLIDSPFFDGPLSAAEDIVAQIFIGMMEALSS